MRYDKQKTAQRLSGVPMKDRVFIYNAAIFIQFLGETFMPLDYFLSTEGRNNMGTDLLPKDMREPKDLKEKAISLGEIYEYYKLWRQHKQYTSPIESRYKISTILKKMTAKRNGWRFTFQRRGVAQIVYFSPLELRARVPLEVRRDFFPPTPKPDVEIGLDQGDVDDARTEQVMVKVSDRIPSGMTEMKAMEKDALMDALDGEGKDQNAFVPGPNGQPGPAGATVSPEKAAEIMGIVDAAGPTGPAGGF